MYRTVYLESEKLTVEGRIMIRGFRIIFVYWYIIITVGIRFQFLGG